MGPGLDDPEAVSASETHFLRRNFEISNLISRITTLESQNDSTIHLLGKGAEPPLSNLNRDDTQKAI